VDDRTSGKNHKCGNLQLPGSFYCSYRHHPVRSARVAHISTTVVHFQVVAYEAANVAFRLSSGTEVICPALSMSGRHRTRKHPLFVGASTLPAISAYVEVPQRQEPAVSTDMWGIRGWSPSWRFLVGDPLVSTPFVELVQVHVILVLQDASYK